MKINPRANGLIELICRHDVGHPSRALTEMAGRTFRDADEVHGCCHEGCCTTPSFRKRERQFLGEAKEMGRGE